MSVIKKVYVDSIIGYPESKVDFGLDVNTNLSLATNESNKLEIKNFQPCLLARSIKEAVEETSYYLKQCANILAQKFRKPFGLNESTEVLAPLTIKKIQDKFRLTGSVVYSDPADKSGLINDHSSEFIIEMIDNGDLILKYYQINLFQESQKEFIDTFIIFLREGADLLDEKLN